MTRIGIADDHAVVRKGLRQIFAEAPDLTVSGEAASADELLTLLRVQLRGRGETGRRHLAWARRRPAA